MGKRKRRGDEKKAPADSTPHAPQGDLQTESSATQSLASIMDAMDRSLRRSPGDQSPINQNHGGSSHSKLLRHSLHPGSRHYSRRSSANHSDASPSNWKGSPAYDPKTSFLGRNDLSAFPYRDGRETIFQKQERIRSTSSSQYGVSRDFRKMECRICKKRLRKNPFFLGSSVQSGDLSVVAVLVCGHAYHADCLEQETDHHEDKHNPPCPICLGDV